MEISSVRVQNFKRLQDIEVPISDITYLVGGNNAGKSSLLQAIHTAAMAAQVSAETKQTVVAEELLRYSPTARFEQIGYGGIYENQQHGRRASITFKGLSDGESESYYRIEMYRGRNYNNVGIVRTGAYAGFGANIIDSTKLFSVYVPGLAGLPHREEYKSDAYIFRCAAGGDANLVLRNILLRLRQNGKIEELCGMLCGIFPAVSIHVDFDDKHDLYINVNVSTGIDDSNPVPIDLCGTGLLQAIQICAYVLWFDPHLLLLDEPDSHLHPSNQALLSSVLSGIPGNKKAKIILATHSRHLINSAPSGSTFVVIRDGKTVNNTETDTVKMLMDLGALDKLDNSPKSTIFFTEDSNTYMLKSLISQHIDPDKFDVIPYNGSSNFAVIYIISELKRSVFKESTVIIHRDRDFMTASEASAWEDEVQKFGITPYLTKFSDIEAYFCNPNHLASLYGIPPEQADDFLLLIYAEFSDAIRSEFRNKRRDLNKKLYADGGSPATSDLFPDDAPATLLVAKGKFILKKINEKLSSLTDSKVKPTTLSEVVLAPDLHEVILGKAADAEAIGSVFD